MWRVALFAVAAVLVVGVVWPSAFDWVERIGLRNRFRDSKWVKRIHSPLLFAATYALAMMALEYVSHGFAVAGFGALLLWMWAAPEVFDFLDNLRIGKWKLGKWNVGRWKHTRAVAFLTLAFGLEYSYVQWLFDTIVFIAAACLMWQLEPNFLREAVSWFTFGRSKDKSKDEAAGAN